MAAVTVTQGMSGVTTAGAYNAPASGRGVSFDGSHIHTFFTLTSVTFGANGLIAFNPRALGVIGAVAIVRGWYQPAGSSDHQYIVQSWDPVNLNLQCWDLTDNDAGGTDNPAGQFIIEVISE